MEGDLYGDIDDVRERLTSENAIRDQVEARAQESEQRAKKYKKDVAAYKLKAEQLRQRCTMLEKNLSCLFKTAWANLHRKDTQIVDLKQQIKEFRKITGMVAPGVKCDDVNMQEDDDDTQTKANAAPSTENRSTQQLATEGTRTDTKHDGGSGRSTNGSVDRGQAASRGRAAPQVPNTVIKQEPGAHALDRTTTAAQHRQQPRNDRDDRRAWQGRREGSSRDGQQSRGGSPSRYGRGPRRDSSPPPRPPRDRAARFTEQLQRDNRELRERDGRDRGGGGREFRGRDTGDLRDGKGNNRKAQGSGEDRQRPSPTWQRRQGGRSRSRSPRS